MDDGIMFLLQLYRGRAQGCATAAVARSQQGWSSARYMAPLNGNTGIIGSIVTGITTGITICGRKLNLTDPQKKEMFSIRLEERQK